MNQFKSQALGLLLGFSTTIGCIFYEKIVSNFSYLTFMIIWICEGVIMATIGSIIFDNSIKEDFQKFFSNSKYMLWTIVYVATGTTSLLWYTITKHQGVMVGSIYEVKYIVMLAIFYYIFGEKELTINLAIGIIFAIMSIFFISKT